MKKMNKKLVLIVLACFILFIGGFTLVTLQTAKEETAKEVPIEQTAGKKDSAKGDQKKAESLLGEVVSQEEVNKQVGTWADFEMSSEGCERGVYSGKFYYDDFTIFSKTYDKGKTYHIEAINEK